MSKHKATTGGATGRVTLFSGSSKRGKGVPMPVYRRSKKGAELWVVMDRPYTYEYYTKNTLKVGERHKVEGMEYIDEYGDYHMVLGHGVEEVVPHDCFHLEEVTYTPVVRRVE